MRLVRSFAPLAVALALFAAGCSPQNNAQSPEQRKVIEEIVRETLEKNPEIVLKALDALRAQRDAAEREAMRPLLAQLRKPLQDDPPRLLAGNPQGDITVVEFFDYRCGYCKQVFPALMALIKEDSQVRVVFKEFPVLGEESRLASRAALASEAQGKYLPFHVALMEYKGKLTEESLFQVAREVGLDADRLRQDMTNPAIDEALARSAELAGVLELRGTPAFVIGETLVPGAIDLAEIKKLVAAERKRKG